MNSMNAFAWSVRRELWENRFVYWTPIVFALLALAGFAYVSFHGTHRTPPQLHGLPYALVASIILVAGWLASVFYAVDALGGERRERSILFWKSMPVSDAVTVASKAAIALLAIPLMATAVALVTQLAMMGVSAASGSSTPAWPMGTQALVLLYGVGIHILWFAPIYAYLLLVSACAARAALLWAIVPFAALAGFERIALGTGWIPNAINYRIFGGMQEGFTRDALRQPITHLSQTDPARFFSNPNLWLGLAVAIAFLALAVQLRRRREPI
jgi:ABC-2 type transport system permease protein